MSDRQSFYAALTRLRNRVAAWLAARSRPATAFVSQPEPRTVGSFARGRQLTAGNLLFAGHFIETKGAVIWDLDPPDAAFEEEIHGFAWLDDLAAVGDAATRGLAQEWLWAWIERYGRGTGPGWTPELAGRRLIRWIQHALFLLRGQDSAASAAFYRALGAQTIFLGRRWGASAPGLPRFEALTGLIYAGLSLEGMEKYAEPAHRALGLECARQVDAQGGIPTRNPEELLEVFTLLTWAAAALDEADLRPDPQLTAAIGRIAPTLRTLRHSDGGLARFHGGGRGIEGRLEQALAASGNKKRQADGLAMGYARLSAGRTSIVVDAAPPPTGKASFNAHASTLAFELTSGRRPLIVNCGSGAIFGEEWRRAGRATPSHSSLSLEGYSSARLGAPGWIGAARREMLEDAPVNVPVQLTQAPDGIRFEGGHDGYVATHGLTHARILELTFDGRGLVGEDMLMTLDDAAKRRFDAAMDAVRLAGVPYQIRFHIHPEVDVALDMGGAAVSMALRSGEIWVFRHEGDIDLSLEPSVYLEKGRLRPRATQQIVLSGRAMGYATRVRWSLAKAQDTAMAVRDLAQDEVVESF
ncbi:heparinase II/III family protein [Aestuariicoccus sp. MJ-SS9]|uniref:heparinase II/III family protein n=1 Tax=Aestuariicoccus sp. MJ-SS9 TaxID=3079855 RepID=UPI0029079146|nr:heparinase II/III family protein [Aestuariicoccus sp. MJ-SS9]MDU8911342.1 heparinase II/III family protein [Aestuariicoccus sp. MJ-SS9]